MILWKKTLLALLALCLWTAGMLVSAEVVDRILAVVDDEVITLTDVRIVEAFGLFEGDAPKPRSSLHKDILDELIVQKLVNQMAAGDTVVEEEELESALTELIQKMEPGKAEKSLLEFGLDWDDLKKYIAQNLLYEKIVSGRFERGVMVTLEEIETYYEQVFVPEQRKRGEEVPPMVDVLDRIETAIKKQKMELQIKEWIAELKRRANIQIFLE